MGKIEVKNLTYGYSEATVIKNLSMTISQGEILLIEGENGAGKTTLLKCICNLINNGKNIFINGEEVYKNKEVLKEISFVMSEDTLYDYMTVDENIKFFKMLFKEDEKFTSHINDMIVSLKLEEYKGYLVKNLSQGTRSKIYLSIMMAKKHKFLILDEPFTALDNKSQSIIIDKIKKSVSDENKAVIFITHIEEFKNIATRKINLKKIVN